MVKKVPSRQAPDAPTELVEIQDADDRTLAILPLREAHKQGLMHRSVLVLLYNGQNKIYLQRRGKNKSSYPGYWDLSATGHVKAGESREDGALRELREELGIERDSLTLLHSLKASAATAWEHVTIFSAGRVEQPPRPNPEEVESGAFYDHNDVTVLVEHFRELLTPALLYAYDNNLMFPSSRE